MNRVASALAEIHEIAAVFSHPTAEQSLVGVLQGVSGSLLRLLDIDHSTITLLDERGQCFEVQAECPHFPLRLIGQQIPIQNRPTQLSLVNDRRPIVANTLADHALVSESDSFREIVRALDIRSLLIVPMVTDGDTIGTISIDTIGRTKQFTEEEVELCETVANQTAAFIAILRLRDEQQKHRRQAEMLALTPGRTAMSRREEKVALALFAELEKVVRFRKASLQLIVDGKRTLVGTLGFDKSRSDPWLLRPVENDPIIRDIVHTQKPKILADTATAKQWEKTADTSDVNSWIGMPLILQGEVIGILTLDHDQAGFYGNIAEDVLAHLDRLAAQAAQDLRDAYDLEVAQQQIHALEIIRRFAETVATKLDPKELQLAIVSMISKGLECTRCSLFLLEQRGECDSLVCKAACQASSCATASGLVLPNPRPGYASCPVCHAFQSGDSTFVDDREQDRRFDFSHELYRGARSIIVVPLKIANQAIGAVLAVHERPGWFTKADQLLLETLTRQAASAIERDFGLDLVHSIGNAILGATEVDIVLKDVVSGAMRLTHADSGVIYELSEDCAQVVRSFKDEGSVHPKPRLDDPGGITRTVISRKSILEIPDIDMDGRVNPQLRGRYRSMFAVPLLLGESAVGVLYLNSKNVRGLTETERLLLATLAGQAALAIHRARLYEQIKDSAMTYRSLFDNIPQLVCWKDTQSRFIWANASFCRSLHRNLDEIIGKSDFDFYPEQDAKKYVCDDRKVIQSKQPMVLDEQNQPRADAPPVWVRVVKTPVLDAAGEVRSVQAIFWDITEEKQVTERWRSLVEQSPDSIVIHKNGVIMVSNPAARRLFGASSPAELEGRSILDFIDESSRQLAIDRLRRLMNKQDVAPMVEMRVRRSTGEIVDVEVYAWPGPVQDEFQVVFHDVTRTKTLLREMHHRVRRSFNQVDGFLTLQEQFAKGEEVSRAFDILRERIQAMGLVHSILYRTGKESDVEMDLYLKELRQALLLAHGSCERITVNFAADGIVLKEKQATACGLIVTELVSNSLLHAFPHGPPPDIGGRVSVMLCADGDMLRLEVSDNGIGMPSPSKGSGEGIGLSLVRSLVADDLRGTVKMTDAKPGTRFTIQFQWSEHRKEAGSGP
jgi:PAS domain S-box-containing protein